LLNVGADINKSILICRPMFGLLASSSQTKVENGSKPLQTAVKDLWQTFVQAANSPNITGFLEALKKALESSAHLDSNTFVDGMNESWDYTAVSPFIFPDGPLDNFQRCNLEHQPAKDASLGECIPFALKIWSNFYRTMLNMSNMSNEDPMCH